MPIEESLRHAIEHQEKKLLTSSFEAPYDLGNGYVVIPEFANRSLDVPGITGDPASPLFEGRTFFAVPKQFYEDHFVNENSLSIIRPSDADLSASENILYHYFVGSSGGEIPDSINSFKGLLEFAQAPDRESSTPAAEQAARQEAQETARKYLREAAIASLFNPNFPRPDGVVTFQYTKESGLKTMPLDMHELSVDPEFQTLYLNIKDGNFSNSFSMPQEEGEEGDEAVPYTLIQTPYKSEEGEVTYLAVPTDNAGSFSQDAKIQDDTTDEAFYKRVIEAENLQHQALLITLDDNQEFQSVMRYKTAQQEKSKRAEAQVEEVLKKQLESSKTISETVSRHGISLDHVKDGFSILKKKIANRQQHSTPSSSPSKAERASTILARNRVAKESPQFRMEQTGDIEVTVPTFRYKQAMFSMFSSAPIQGDTVTIKSEPDTKAMDFTSKSKDATIAAMAASLAAMHGQRRIDPNFHAVVFDIDDKGNRTQLSSEDFNKLLTLLKQYNLGSHIASCVRNYNQPNSTHKKGITVTQSSAQPPAQPQPQVQPPVQPPATSSTSSIFSSFSSTIGNALHHTPTPPTRRDSGELAAVELQSMSPRQSPSQSRIQSHLHSDSEAIDSYSSHTPPQSPMMVLGQSALPRDQHSFTERPPAPDE